MRRIALITLTFERARFLAIFTSNLDEFFMVRVAGLKRRIATGLAVRAASGLMPLEVLKAIWDRADELCKRQATVFQDDITPALREQGIELVRWADLGREEQKFCKRLFKDRVYPVLTPLAVDPAHPFPYISGLSLNLAVVVRNPKTGKEHFARVKVPRSLPRGWFPGGRFWPSASPGHSGHFHPPPRPATLPRFRRRQFLPERLTQDG